jgi:adenine-specific DNA-methyltransferase
MDGTSLTPEQEKLNALRQVLPEAFSEGKIDWEKLKATIGEDINFSNERYVLNWAGKSDAFKVLQMPSTKTLVPAKDESVNFDDTQNIFIKGENLEVLKVLQKSYFGKVKMIYIDPPYNTGNDSFIYPDKFSESKADYEKRVGDKDEEGYMTKDGMFKKNSKENGQYHSNWLNMMMPRLYLAKNLLRQDGVVFISIDDNELNNLNLLMNEVFGEENFLNLITVKAKPSAGASGGGEDKRLKKNVEYLICFTKNREQFEKFNDVYEVTDLMEYIENYKEDGKSWKYTRILKSLGDRKHFTDTVDGAGESIKIFKHENGVIVTVSDIAKEENITEEEAYYKYFEKIFRDTNAQSSIRQRVLDCTDSEDTFYSIEYIPRSGRNKNQLTTLYYKGRNKDLIAWLSDVSEKKGNRLIKKDTVGTLWSNFNWNNVSKEGDIQYPNGKKPISFIKRMIEMTSSESKDDVILDFFAGSGSTAHAVIDMNIQDFGTRKTISVQLPELVSEKDKKKYYSDESLSHINSVSDIFIARLKRAIDKYKNEIAENINKVQAEITKLQGELPTEETKTEIESLKTKIEQLKNQDLGFKVLKLEDSNFKQWQQIEGKDAKALAEQMKLFVDPVSESATIENMVYELLLKSGKDINSPIEKKDSFYKINDNELILLLEKATQEIIDAVIAEKPIKVIALDKLFKGNDQLKTNTVLQMKDAGIEFKTI